MGEVHFRDTQGYCRFAASRIARRNSLFGKSGRAFGTHAAMHNGVRCDASLMTCSDVRSRAGFRTYGRLALIGNASGKEFSGRREPRLEAFSIRRVEVILPDEPQRSMGLRTLLESGEPNSL